MDATEKQASRHLDRWMFGKIDRWMDGHIDGKTDRYKDGQTDERTYKTMDRWTDG